MDLQAGGRLFHPFKAKTNDHFVTSLEALRVELPALMELRSPTRPCVLESFAVYDPYHGNGTVAAQWRALRIHSVLYEVVGNKVVPGPYGMLVAGSSPNEGPHGAHAALPHP